jgi:hypothetical protein
MERFVFFRNKMPVYMLLAALAVSGPLAAQDQDGTPIADRKAPADTYTEQQEPVKDAETPAKNPVTAFLFGSTKYAEYDSAKIYTGTVLGDIKLQEAKVIVNPKTGEAGIQTPYQSSNYALLFNTDVRHALDAAVRQYLADFEAHVFKKGSRKTEQAYGVYEAYIAYGTISAVMNAEGKPDVYFGYRFKGKSPYFLITVKTTPNINKNKGTYEVKDSAELLLYMTKAQAQQLCSELSDDAVNDVLLRCNEETSGSGKTTKGDVY